MADPVEWAGSTTVPVTAGGVRVVVEGCQNADGGGYGAALLPVVFAEGKTLG